MKGVGIQQECIELRTEYPRGCHVAFDSDATSLEGVYRDELSAFRARKVWIEILENQFLLEKGHDFSTEIQGDLQAGCYLLRCTFLTACGRYAFWRLTNCQAPEAQYNIETAHIPHAESLYEQILRAPDMEEKRPLSILEVDETLPAINQDRGSSVVHWIRELLQKR